MNMGDESLYNYELKKSIVPGFLTKGVRIRDSWVARCRRYLGSGEPDLRRLILFIQRGLYDGRVDGFNEKALDGTLTVSQQWLLLHLILRDGIPEWIRDHENDEDAPELKVAEPEVETIASKVVQGAVKPVTSLTGLVSGGKTQEAPDEAEDNASE